MNKEKKNIYLLSAELEQTLKDSNGEIHSVWKIYAWPPDWLTGKYTLHSSLLH